MKALQSERVRPRPPPSVRTLTQSSCSFAIEEIWARLVRVQLCPHGRSDRRGRPRMDALRLKTVRVERDGASDRWYGPKTDARGLYQQPWCITLNLTGHSTTVRLFFDLVSVPLRTTSPSAESKMYPRLRNPPSNL